MKKERLFPEDLEREGWRRQFVANEPRLSEAVDMYKEVGFEVRLEPLPEDPECEDCEEKEGDQTCRICFQGFEDQYRIIFTRSKKATGASPEEDLF